MPNYIVNDTHILHDGTLYAPGDLIELTEDQAERLSVAPAPSADQLPPDRQTVAQLTEALTALKVEIPPGAKKADLVALYLAATASAEG